MRYQVKIKFKQDFIDQNNKDLIIGIKSLPEKGKANQELIKKLAKYFNVDVSKIKIISGLSSRNKVVEIFSHT
ncbi:MAG: hypothetical protein A2418_03165 [Candidatus Brennerbacteria bacterium RIFOXYC1_FULL_41_11]|uniref:Uncharacterized protein n=1 Tax=Candidatus Brennerbacteria bacterium RIFOXYD1_FULL_41_16 TaxID=1797529 RepID=A0A1G1XLT7_9BACT|nr:MAG: hypothetical protein A2391_00770 [Candidatus Brennerbacteria bacterium RIFOXYB1_FULL_41_13]OGY39831.1 MAG: hypothetical protein A2418_03165 [Candidatus Brennerbacteria bacterium RIFOXYC1_FULL_41_11]OGY40570.1 MAG: hypothetical protein A2570_02435 [Candidatus Brennerbacteria bacterium RIFOXYD1_FULL_41_16]